ncbi:MAG: tRNA guanosine(34) transglycosylase Tgt [Caulobacteraceae bacterium]|nr:tRNA guanosine(34) transglycosylase Tgt [Caulobacteraceae bacterium]
MTDDVFFAVSATDGDARLGEVKTQHGKIRTPAFMPVGTAGTVKAMRPEAVRALGADIVLANTYHLMLAPGAERIAALGGLHKFMNWPHPILTDSGGFQVMSLAKLRKLSERGVTFQSHIDGSLNELTPERAMEVQRLLGSDIQMQFDECVRLPCSHDEAERAMRLSLRWGERSKAAFGRLPGRAVFGIVQGGVEADLRAKSARALVEIGFDGYAIGGLAVGEPQAEMLAMIEETLPHLPADKPRYLMGVGTPHDLLQSLKRGIDMFDCVMPTRAGRHGLVYTRRGRMNLRNARFADDPRPVDPLSSSPMARDYSSAYWRHLVKSGEILAMMGLTEINLAYYQDLMAGARKAIGEGSLADYIEETERGWREGEALVYTAERAGLAVTDRLWVPQERLKGFTNARGGAPEGRPPLVFRPRMRAESR